MKRKLQIKTTVRYHLSLVRMAIAKTINTAEGVEKREPSCTLGRNVNWYSHYGRQYGDSFKKKSGIKPPYNPAIPLLGIYPEEIRIEKDTWTYEMFYINLTVNTWTVACQAPPSMGFSRNTGVGGHSLLQRIFPTRGSNPGLLQCSQIWYCLSHQGNP